MRSLLKWNDKKKAYEEYKVPNKWKCSVYEADIENIINCAGCGKEIKFGESYSSRKIHNKMGFAYGVCEECFDKEYKNFKGAEE